MHPAHPYSVPHQKRGMIQHSSSCIDIDTQLIKKQALTCSGLSIKNNCLAGPFTLHQQAMVCRRWSCADEEAAIRCKPVCLDCTAVSVKSRLMPSYTRTGTNAGTSKAFRALQLAGSPSAIMIVWLYKGDHDFVRPEWLCNSNAINQGLVVLKPILAMLQALHLCSGDKEGQHKLTVIAAYKKGGVGGVLPTKTQTGSWQLCWLLLQIAHQRNSVDRPPLNLLVITLVVLPASIMQPMCASTFITCCIQHVVP